MTAIPVGNVIINIGDVPQWFIAIAAAFVVYKVWRSADRIVEIRDDIGKVRHETNSMRSALELASKAEGRLEGRQEMREETAAAKTKAKEALRTDAVADALTAAKVRAADPDAMIPAPTPVAVVTVAVDTPNNLVADHVR